MFIVVVEGFACKWIDAYSDSVIFDFGKSDFHMYNYYYYIIYYIEYIHILRTVETCAPNHRKRPKFEFKILKQLNK